ncbi:MAG TPA: BatD family protein [Flavobacterium sp.]|nr:BatD family protein [Flavobacterium sp.]
MRTKHLIFTFLALCTSIASVAQFQFRAEVSRQSIGINQAVELRLVMNADGDNLSLPDLENFDIVGGPMQSASQTIINGRASYEKSYIFYLKPKKKGKLTIGKATVEYDGRKYESEPITIEVGDAVKEPPRQQRQRPRNLWDEFFGGGQAQQQVDQENWGKGIHLVAEVSNNNPYVNEPIVVTYKLYVSHLAGIRGMELVNAPQFDGFWNHTVSEKELNISTTTYQGKEFRVATIQKSILMPQKDGRLTIDPLEFDMIVEEGTGNYDWFGRPEVTINKKHYSTGAHVIEVKPLPLDNQPADFTGAVGQFDFTAQVNHNNVKANEPIELTVTAKGNGNLQLFSLPKPVAPASLEIYEPELIENIDKNFSSGMSGSKTEKYVIVPQYKGQYTIQPMTFSYFDPKTKKYQTVTTDEIVIDVPEGPDLPSNNLGNDNLKNTDEFVNIIESTDWETTQSDDFWQSTRFYVWLFLPLILSPIIVGIARWRNKMLADVDGINNKRHQRLAKKYLGEARKKMGDKEPFYEALERCLHNFLKAKLHIETSEMSVDNISELLVKNEVNEANINQFIALKNTCEMARYSPFDIQNMQQDFEQAVEIIDSLDKQIKA